MRLLHALRDVRRVPRRAVTLRAAAAACPALLTAALLAWALLAQGRVFAPLLTRLRAAGSPAPYAAAPRAAPAALVLGALTAGLLAAAHLARTLAADNGPVAAGAVGAATTVPTAVCARCHAHKPPRCHHCRVCNRCCLKMDHHCLPCHVPSSTQRQPLLTRLRGHRCLQARGSAAASASTTTSSSSRSSRGPTCSACSSSPRPHPSPPPSSPVTSLPFAAPHFP